MRRLVLAVALGIFAPDAGGQGAPIQLGVAVQPETVTVGDPFRVVLRIRAPRGATIEFPTAPDTAEKVEPLDPVTVVPSADTAFVEQTATYRLGAWDTGRRLLRFPDVLVREGDVVRRVALDRRLSVFVASVLPQDSTQRVPKPPRAVFEFGLPWWWWLIVGIAAIGVGLLFWWWWRRRAVAPEIVLAPYDDAIAEFDRIDALSLVAAGEYGQHASLHADVVRRYLSRTIPAARASFTTTELLHALRGNARVSLARLQRLLHDVDLVKFAGESLPASRAVELGKEARAIVDAVEAAAQPPDVRKAA